MSWNASTLEFPKTTKSWESNLDINPKDIDGPMLSQLNDAIDAAKLIIKSIPGPNVRVSMSGHANGTGWNKKDGWADDFISVNVYQINK